MNKNYPIETRWNTLKMYQENYENDLKIFLESYEDNTEIDFLENDLFSHKEFLKYCLTKQIDFTKPDDIIINPRKTNSQKRIIEFIENKISTKTTISTTQKPVPAPENSLNWNGTQTEFIELVKALIENGNIKGTQIEIITNLSNVFNIEIKHLNKLITDIKTRNNGSETLFLDKLQKSLFDYITLEKNK